MEAQDDVIPTSDEKESLRQQIEVMLAKRTEMQQRDWEYLMRASGLTETEIGLFGSYEVLMHLAKDKLNVPDLAEHARMAKESLMVPLLDRWFRQREELKAYLMEHCPTYHKRTHER